MNAEIISVGTELLLGHTVNTDAAYVARALSKLGIDLRFACTVGDNSERLSRALMEALGRSSIVVTTGGLGPTGDDLTKETVAHAAGAPLELHQETLERLEKFFNGNPGENQKKQAMLPKGCTVLRNEVGTAPGCIIETGEGKLVIMLPGPPSELRPMLENQATPWLSRRYKACIHSCDVHVWGRGEGDVAAELADLVDGSNPTVATYAKGGEMFVRVTAKAETEEKAKELCRPVVEDIKARLGDVVYSSELGSLEELVVKLLLDRGLTIATAESCTGGLLGKRITDIPGASGAFGMGVVTYSNGAKEQLLGVPPELLARYGAVSEPVARAMAEGIIKKAGSDFGIGVTGISGPGGGSAEKPVGLVYVALAGGGPTEVRRLPMLGGVRPREFTRCRAASFALDMLRRRLEGLPI